MLILLKDYVERDIDAVIETHSDEHNDIFVQDRIWEIKSKYPSEYNFSDIENMCDEYGWELTWIGNGMIVEW